MGEKKLFRKENGEIHLELDGFPFVFFPLKQWSKIKKTKEGKINWTERLPDLHSTIQKIFDYYVPDLNSSRYVLYFVPAFPNLLIFSTEVSFYRKKLTLSG